MPLDLLAPPAPNEPASATTARRFLDDTEMPADELDEAELDKEIAAALCDALARRGDARRLQALSASHDKALAKQARRGIHLLRARGVEIEAAAPTAETETRRAAAEPEPPSVVSPVFGDGECFVFYAQAVPDGVYVAQAQIGESAGILRYTRHFQSRKHWRATLRDLQSRPSPTGAEVPGAYARWLIEDAYRRMIEAGHTPPREFIAQRHLLGEVTEPERHPGMDMASEEDARRFDVPERALELPETRDWLPPLDEVRRLLRRIDEANESALVLDERQRTERAEDLIIKAAVEAMRGPFRARLVRRLLDTGYVIARRGLRPAAAERDRDFAADAALCAVAAHHVETAEPEADRVARALYVRAISRAQTPTE